jgi:hypothetical protein
LASGESQWSIGASREVDSLAALSFLGSTSTLARFDLLEAFSDMVVSGQPAHRQEPVITGMALGRVGRCAAQVKAPSPQYNTVLEPDSRACDGVYCI